MGVTKEKSTLRFLHVTDCHLSKSETVETIDRKVKIAGISHPLRADILQKTIKSLVKKLKHEEVKLDAVLFSGDGTFKGDPEGQIELRKMLLTELTEVGITKPSQIVATPGNHDVKKSSPHSSKERYELFLNAWIKPEPVIVPFLDGIDQLHNFDLGRHVLKDPEGKWAIFPINTANWSQTIISDDENKEISQLRNFLKSTKKGSDYIKTLEKLCSYDVARVSEDQLHVLKELVSNVGDIGLRIAVLHHHLLPVDSHEEFKAFADITNLGLLRQVLRELGFHIVIHGHKHVTTAYYDHIYPDKLDSVGAHPILIISGGTYGQTAQTTDNPFRLIEIDEIPHSPICKIRNISSSSAGRNLKIIDSLPYRLWEYDSANKGPAIIYGTSIDEVYKRAIQTVKQSDGNMMICTIDFQDHDAIPFPLAYPYRGNLKEKRAWFEETVRWWQLPASRIEARIPYIHGSRLKRFGGSLDQIERVISLLNKEKGTSKAIALVTDPNRDFINDRPFASFCFVQFCLRPDNRLDCIGYYRAQEFNYWWPVNVAELRHLQLEIVKEVQVLPGKITTISPYPRLSKNIRQPTKVAVPLIDQWVDNHPERIAKIALTLINSTFDSENDGFIFWKRCLADLWQAATEYHIDGVQVSIEGLSLLKEWLDAAAAPANIIQQIDWLLDVNKSHHDRPNKQKDFNLWKKRVEETISKLCELTNVQLDEISANLA